MMNQRFSGRTVMITGAGQGLGRAFSEAFAREGAKIALVGRTASKLESVQKKITQDGGCARVYPCDISVESEVKQMVCAVTQDLGEVSVLVNNAAYHTSMPVEQTGIDLWNLQISTNLTGTFLCTREVLSPMIKQQYGKIINISSSAAKHFFPGFGAYAASKGGIVSFTHTLSEEVKRHNINVNAVYLGMTNTEYTRQRMADDPAVTISPDDMLQVEDVVPVVLFLASDDARAVMGAAIDVFGKKS